MISGKNASSGGYQLVINSITLTPVLTGITTNENNISVQVGASKQLDYTFSNIPDDAKGVSCTVTSGNENIAVYHNGIITGIKEGNATVRVQSNRYDGVYVDYSVTVLSATVVSGSAILSPNFAVFDKNTAYQTDVNTSVAWNDATSLIDIQHMGITIGAGAYSVSGSVLTVKKEYLISKTEGNHLFHILFDYGNVAELNILISDTTPRITPTPTPVPNPIPSPDPVQNPPSPSPTPIVTKAPEIDQINIPGTDYDAQMDIVTDEKESRLKAVISLPVEEIIRQLENDTSHKPMELILSVISEKLLESMKQEEIKTISLEMVIPSNISDNEKIVLKEIKLDSAILDRAKAVGKEVRIAVIDENGKEQYSWNFTQDNLASSDKSISDINLSLKVGSLSDHEKLSKLLDLGYETTDNNSNGLFINFNHHGELPVQATVRIFVGDRVGIKPGNRIYLYYYN